ncbi:uncharacterized protein CLUP02_06956 [Colletotrichum lupini]|uniref:Zn(2)-C6 fungal-type domain-containing protein n=1 Tax=Colletotrichum lupini TaxID=145971 RepID=A0A9Q8WG82_9PEZI|nr:uncharacterized protein CLUP02_06956 [Colletotrichum lupini]UQC81470.1 hypothetical protein CLUP02_06956 [Colletotrichum lupini]
MDSRATACDLCRLRKVRCDKSVPCFNCRQSSQDCTFTGAGQKPKVPRQRVHVSLQYEEKIDLLDKRLANIESLLLKQQQSAASTQCSCSGLTPEKAPLEVPLSVKDTPHVATDYDAGDEAPPVEGPSSLRFQMAATRRLTESAAIELGTSCYVNAVASAHRVVGSQSPAGSSQRHLAQKPVTYRNMPLPPIAAVVGVLRQLKDNPPSSFFVLRCFLPCSDFIDLCRNVYFSVDDYTAIDFIIVNSGLHSLFTEYFCPPSVGQSEPRKQSLAWGAMCRNALTAAVATIDAGLSAKAKNVQALILGTTHAIEMAKPWLAWRLICFAAQLCMAAGFHDESLIVADDESTRNVKALLFWHVYGLEKSIALRVGRASMIRDSDIDIPKGLNLVCLPRLWDKVVPFWVKNASIHSKIYDLLYSRSAQLVSQEDLSERADSLLADLKLIEPVNLVCRTVELVTQFKYDDGNVQSGQLKDFLCQWRLLQTPFIPLLVVFCHIVETQDSSDAQRLKCFADSLEQGADLSPSAKDFYDITRQLYMIAEKHIQTSSEQDWASVPSLSTLGLTQFYPANAMAGNYHLAAEHGQSNQDMEMMFGGEQVMGFF